MVDGLILLICRVDFHLIREWTSTTEAAVLRGFGFLRSRFVHFAKTILSRWVWCTDDGFAERLAVVGIVPDDQVCWANGHSPAGMADGC